MPSPSHICPKCYKAQGADAFVNERGKPTKWCFWCRTSYRDRLTNLHQRDATKPKRGEEIDAASVATHEGYKDHPLASLLALSHIAGAKRALAIRDGSSWRGKKAWRAYYEAKRALEAKAREMSAFIASLAAFGDAWHEDGNELTTRVAVRWAAIRTKVNEMLKRDPNSSGVS